MPFGISAGVSGLFNSYSARQSQKHQEKMYKHRYQWASADMRKAGINPLLLQSQGPGSASSSAQAAPIDTSKSFSAGALQRAGIKTAETEQNKNIAAAEASNAQASVAREQARSAKMAADREARAQDHWEDPASSGMLSTAKAMTDAGMRQDVATGAAGVRGAAENLTGNNTPERIRDGVVRGARKIRKWYNENKPPRRDTEEVHGPPTSAKEVGRRPVNEGLSSQRPKKRRSATSQRKK